MPRKWTNSKGVNVFNEKAIDRNIKYIKKEVGLYDDKKQYKPKNKKNKQKGGK